MKWIIFGALAALLAFAAACGDDDDDDGGDNGGDDTGSADTVCQEKEELDSAVASLTDVDVIAEGTEALNASLANVRTSLDNLGDSVSDEVADEVEGMETAVDDAEEILSDLDDASLNEQIDAVQSALTGVATASVALGTALQEDCP